MKKFLTAMMIALFSLALGFAQVAEAKRLGGGTSFGRQSQNVTRQAPMQSSQATNAARPAAPAPAPAAPPPKPASPWKGILGGALLGLGLGALFSHFGLGGALGGALGSLLMIALLAAAAFFVFRMLRRKSEPAGPQPAYASNNWNATPEIGSRIEPAALQSLPLAATASAQVVNATWGVPADFDAPAFLRNAKTYFLRLQTAWDRADLKDIREFTTPEMFAEVKMQIGERGASANHTDVVQLDAELLGIETVGDEYLASVRFSGLIKESEQAPAEHFAEVWNLAKPAAAPGGWLLAGIQQLS